MPHIYRDKQYSKTVYRDRIDVIKAIDENYIQPLVKEGKARLVHTSQGDVNPEFGEGITNSAILKRYAIDLKTNLPFVIIQVFVDFLLDERTKRGKLSIRGRDAWLLGQAYENQGKGRSLRLPDEGLKVLAYNGRAR